ncbi:hypothetical protein BDW59DRAFT_152888 [Aspergillus cavernicola]|uniref:Uncharacterized protein n=1 Tax=Aspergillus cavernicola TaxID=176166 RepID=A0ABR4HPI0_9EURO
MFSSDSNVRLRQEERLDESQLSAPGVSSSAELQRRNFLNLHPYRWLRQVNKVIYDQDQYLVGFYGLPRHCSVSKNNQGRQSMLELLVLGDLEDIHCYKPPRGKKRLFGS